MPPAYTACPDTAPTAMSYLFDTRVYVGELPVPALSTCGVTRQYSMVLPDAVPTSPPRYRPSPPSAVTPAVEVLMAPPPRTSQLYSTELFTSPASTPPARPAFVMREMALFAGVTLDVQLISVTFSMRVSWARPTSTPPRKSAPTYASRMTRFLMVAPWVCAKSPVSAAGTNSARL